KLYVDSWRWADTPFYVRMGKRLARRETTIAIQFKAAPHPPFEETQEEGLRPNVLLVHVQPDEGVSLAIGAKMPGQGMRIRTVHMDFLYGGAFRTAMPEAYERLILDCLVGDHTLFTRADEIEEQWLLVDTLVPPPDSGRDPMDAAASVECYRRPGTERRVCSEVVELQLHGRRAKAPASVVSPLLISDLPVFCRWRGEPPFGSPELDQLVAIA